MIKRGLVDIHSHILPGVDDGASNMEETVTMLNMAYKEGIRCIYATPHFNSGKEKYTKESLEAVFYEVKDIAKTIGEEGIELILGNEIYCREGVLELLEAGLAHTMGDSKYILVEFDFTISLKKLYKELKSFIEAGYRPILAHIERYSCLYNNYTGINDLRLLGVALQINTGSVMKLFKSKAVFCRKLIREGKISFLGSDCHRMDWRPPIMESAVDVLSKKTPKAVIDRMLYTNIDILQHNKFL